MKNQISLILLLITFLVSCKKDEVKEEPVLQNYLKASINGKTFVAYEDPKLNKDTVPNSFHFSFGQIVTKKIATNKTDTCLSISATLNGKNLQVCFPKTQRSSVFPVYCQSDIAGSPSAFYHIVLKLITEKFEIFHTQNIMKDARMEGKSLGSVIIDEIDYRKRFVKGRFSFSAYGYDFANEIIEKTDNTVSIKDGEFYYHWDESLKL